MLKVGTGRDLSVLKFKNQKSKTPTNEGSNY